MHKARGSSPLSFTFRGHVHVVILRNVVERLQPQVCARKICRPTALSRHSVNPGGSPEPAVFRRFAHGGRHGVARSVAGRIRWRRWLIR
jgi:hypothetical protein